MQFTAAAHACTGLLQRRRGSRADPVTEDDVLRAMDKLKVLGGGFDVVTVSLYTLLLLSK